MADARSALRRAGECRWEIPASYRKGMRVPVRVYSDDTLLELAAGDQALEQAVNVAFLPGIVGRSLAMPDFHWGYGFPIGGVAATRVEDGVVSPGGVGFDINCGARLLATDLAAEEVLPRLPALLDGLFREVPCGVGGRGPLRVDGDGLDGVMAEGAGWMVSRGFGRPEDLESCESRGRLPGADPAAVGRRARERGRDQLGTLGSGNHFLEIQAVEEVFDRRTADAFGIGGPGRVVVMLHSGSRGFGHQVCQDHLDRMEGASRKYGIALPDRQLACAPLSSPEGRDYMKAMACAANYAWANRQLMTHSIRRSFAAVFGRAGGDPGPGLVYDVAHNIAKIEVHRVEGREARVCVHRKGATRAFPAGHPEVPERCRGAGQPVLVPGDMGRSSFVAVGLPGAMEETFGSACHGAGRVKGRREAVRDLRGVDLARRLESRGILVRCRNRAALAEEASEAYKDVSGVVGVLERAGIARRVARLRPLGVLKG